VPRSRVSGEWTAISASAAGRRRGRTRTDAAMTALFTAAAAFALLPLVLIIGWLVVRGGSALTPALFTELPKPVGEAGGGLGNAFAGTTLLVALALVLGLPVGLLAGAFLAARRRSRLAAFVRTVADVLNGTPSIVIGIATWAAVVRPMGRFSALAGGVALAVILAPLVARSAEEMLRVVPEALRQAALALGYSEWRVFLRIVGPSALPGIATGVLVAVARIAGETAPLLFTAFGNPVWSVALDRPIAAVPIRLYTYALSPYEAWQRQAMGAALVLVTAVALLTLLGRALAARRRTPGR
jgi:phosphate transport system permease protein